MQNDYSKLLGRMKECGMTQEALACAIGISESTLNLKLNNKGVFTQKEIRNIWYSHLYVFSKRIYIFYVF